jgi:hypothetical protein
MATYNAKRRRGYEKLRVKVHIGQIGKPALCGLEPPYERVNDLLGVEPSCKRCLAKRGVYDENSRVQKSVHG